MNSQRTSAFSLHEVPTLGDEVKSMPTPALSTSTSLFASTQRKKVSTMYSSIGNAGQKTYRDPIRVFCADSFRLRLPLVCSRRRQAARAVGVCSCSAKKYQYSRWNTTQGGDTMKRQTRVMMKACSAHKTVDESGYQHKKINKRSNCVRPHQGVRRARSFSAYVSGDAITRRHLISVRFLLL